MQLILSTCRLEQTGGNHWRRVRERREVHRPALLISDMWDRHWSAGATARVEELAPRIDRFAAAWRAAGGIVIHAPSDTMDFYADHPARLRALALSPEPPVSGPFSFPLLPIDAADGGSDTCEDVDEVNRQVWTRQHAAITIDPERDYLIGNEGELAAAILKAEQADFLVYAGVHLNMCIFKSRTFSILPMRHRGVETGFIRELVDSMYDPAKPPYVNHAAGTALVADYLEKFICPSVEWRPWRQPERSGAQ